jgi:hypothetical protein
MRTTTGAILLVIGVVALFAAIVGGGVKIREIEVGSLPSRWRQLFLAIFGVVVGIIGLVMVTDDGSSGGDDTATQNVDSVDQGTESNAPETAGEANAADQNADAATPTESKGTEAAADNNFGEGSTK